MDQQELQKNIALYYSKLSPKLQGFFSDMKWLETLKEIGERYRLTEEQKQALGTETTLVLLGIANPNDYSQTLTKELNVSEDVAGKVLSEVNNSLLNAIHEDLVDAFEANINIKAVNDRLEKLPEEVREIVTESNYQNTLFEIGTANKLNVEQMGELETCLIDLITGVVHSEQFENSVKNSLKLTNEQANVVTREVNEKILKEIRQKMVGISEKSMKQSEEFGGKIENDKQILNSAGIEILSKDAETLPAVEKLELTTPKPEPHPILAQKLSGAVQTPVVNTEHSLENITRTVTSNTQGNVADKPKVDPYREIPE